MESGLYEGISIFIPLAAGYLIGSFPTGVIISKKRYHIDVREIGSGNIGATNVARVFGIYAGASTLIVDVLKGFLPVWIARHSFGAWPQTVLALAVGLVLGHCFSIFLKGRGGKGVATSLGVVLALDVWAGLVGILTYALALILFRISSVGSLIGLLAVNSYVAFFTNLDGPTQAVIASISLVVLVRHHSNIRKLFTGQYKSYKKKELT